MKKAIYLKVNRCDNWAIDNLHRWMKISMSLGYDSYIICDNEKLLQLIETMEFFSYFTIIRSIKDKSSQEIIEKITIPKWNNAGYAHLSTFVHAKNNGYEWFWNVDADDTFFCLPVDRVTELLKVVEDYSQINDIDCNSLDMWYSKLGGRDWSFGITYTRGSIPWESIILNNSILYETNEINHGNIDNYFFYLRKINAASIETWYCENLRFIHYSEDFFNRLMQSGMYHWKDGRLLSPIAKQVAGLELISDFPIIGDTVRFDIKITDSETVNTLLYYSRDGHVRNLTGYVPWSGIEGDAIVRMRQIHLNASRFGTDNSEYVLFGTGQFFNDHIEQIKKYNNIRFVADNDKNKQDKEIQGIRCIPPEKISEVKNAIVIIMVLSDSVRLEMEKQLSSMQINSFMHYFDWERAVFSDNMFI